jgi:CRISPR system Cascade subunit CasA
MANWFISIPATDWRKMMNLLTEPVFRVETPDGQERLSLPQLLEALGLDRVESLPGLQRHQEDAFHIFLCYLAGAVLARESQTNPCQNAEFWLEGIRRLTGREDDCAWILVVEDVTQPAFMQAPVSKKADFGVFKPKADTPDALDVLPTAKNHDVKSAKSGISTTETWIYALISLQTMAGFFGKGNYGIARMNGGFGSRSMVTINYAQQHGGRWQRDIGRLLAEREAVLNAPWGYKADGLVMLWLFPWDLNSSFTLKSLDPFFLEISRAVRLVNRNDRIQALGAPSNSPRINASETGGVLGDPWTPINLNDKKKGQSALTVSSNGLTPELLRNLIFEDGYKSAAMQLHDVGREGQACQFTASVLVRGQGTTDGFHQAALPIPGKTGSRLFRRGPDRDRLAKLSNEALTDARAMQNSVLKTAVIALLEGGPEQLNFDKREVTAWLTDAVKQFSEAWSSDYFPWLWRTAEQEDADAARLEWLKTLRDKAKVVLDDAIARYPARSGRRYRSRVKAEGMFAGCLNKTFPELKETRHESNRSD